MAQTPYAPPAAAVSDPPERVYPKPASVTRAVQALWLCVVLVLVVSLLDFARLTESGAALATSLVTVIFSAALLVLIAVKLNAGRNWARWLFLGLFLLGTAMFGVAVLMAPQSFAEMAAVEQVSAVVQFVLQIVALVLLFTPASTQWFLSMRSST